MKLLTITNRFNLASNLIFLSIAGLILFLLLRHHLKQELDEELNTEKIHITNALQSMDSILDPTLIIGDNLIVKKTSGTSVAETVLFDTLMFDNVENEIIPFRAILFSAKSKSVKYDILIKKSEIETSDLVFSIFQPYGCDRFCGIDDDPCQLLFLKKTLGPFFYHHFIR